MSTVSKVTLAWVAAMVAAGGYLQVHATAPTPTSRPIARSAVAQAQATPATAPRGAARPEAASVRAALDQYCVKCHNQKLKTGGVTLDQLDLTNLARDTDVWEKVVTKLSTQAMPPMTASPRPDEPTYHRLVSWLAGALDQMAAADPNPGRPSIRRLNRTEYTNAIRDLLALDIDGASLLPVDESGYGFDNIGDVLSVSPSLLQRYMFAAQKVSWLAIGDPKMRPAIETYRTTDDLLQNTRMSDDLPFRSRGGLAFTHNFPVDGEYLVKIRLHRNFQNNGIAGGVRNRERLDLRVDGQRVTLFTVGGECVGSNEPRCIVPVGVLMNSQYEQNADDGLEIRVPMKAGPKMVSATFIERNAAEPETLGGVPTLLTGRGGNAIERVEIRGPFAATQPGDTPSRQRIFTCSPSRVQDEEACAEKILSTLARRAYRRATTKADAQVLLTFYRDGRKNATFEHGIEFALERILTSPNFLLRVEPAPAGIPAGKAYRIGDVELASRLSFFLWSSIPDDELLDVAIRGKLREPQVLDQQVRRMLADPRADELVTNFAAQWLYLRDLRKVQPDPEEFPEFKENLRQDMRHETEMFLASQMREDRPLAELLTANYTFVNQRLAEFYGIPHVYGNYFRRVELTDGKRAGLFGQASILTVTSYATRTSPVQRGKYILANILGAPPPPPPPNVPDLKAASEGGAPPTTVRARMEAHRKNAVCAGCHARMDPLGFALENFDAIGKWRTTDAGTPIDPSGQFPNGETFKGPDDFRIVLAKHQDEFVHTFGGKLLTYALGRGVEYYDMPAIRTIGREAAPDYRWSSLIVGVVKSIPFQMKRPVEPEPGQSSGGQ